jgi:hypothetical protein
MEELTEQEETLLLYLERCCQNHLGMASFQSLTNQDCETLEEWNRKGFVLSGVVEEDLKVDGIHVPKGIRWILLSSVASQYVRGLVCHRYVKSATFVKSLRSLIDSQSMKKEN